MTQLFGHEKLALPGFAGDFLLMNGAMSSDRGSCKQVD